MTITPRPRTPSEAWAELTAGNERFVTGSPQHPNQDAAYRDQLVQGQNPFATFFGCADSRVAAEVIFDQGLGDLFVIRTAGHVLGPSVLGSMEFGLSTLGIPLIVVLGHDSCGAIRATISAVEEGAMPPGYLRDLVERVLPSYLVARAAGPATPDAVEAVHVVETVNLIAARSHVIAEAIKDNRMAIVGLTYALVDGRARVVHVLGDIGAPAIEA